MRRVHKYNAFTLVLTVTRGQIWPKEFQSRLPRSSKAGLASRYVAILSWNLAQVIVRRTHTEDCGYSFSSNTRTLPVHSLPGMKASFHYETLVVYVTCLGRLCISSSRLVLSASKWAKKHVVVSSNLTFPSLFHQKNRLLPRTVLCDATT